MTYNLDFYIQVTNALINAIEGEITEAKIEEKINEAINLLKPEDDIKKALRKEIHSRHKIKMDIPITIREGEFNDWYRTRENKENQYWNRYRDYLDQDKGFSIPVINKLSESLDEIVSNLGDPNGQSSFGKKGLVIGDVQSGKTSTYTGLLAKATDAGYRVFILLTGTMEDLRRQTQHRIDEGFVGKRSNSILNRYKEANPYIGVGTKNKSLDVASLTSTQLDFSTKTVQNMGFSLESLNSPTVFVIKKNKTILTNLYRWLKGQNISFNNQINHSLLLIDDEADNASLNTNSEEHNPTITNALIRDLLGLFKRSNYVGFTATPFANIFINPVVQEGREEELFPKDFITLLKPPYNYIGINSLFTDDAEYQNSIRDIDDIEDYLEEKHKKDYNFRRLPPSLKDAIYTFMISNVVKDLSLTTNSHRSMIVNISRFVDVQNKITRVISEFLSETISDVRLNYQLVGSEKTNPTMLMLHKVWRNEYSDAYEDWSTVKKHLYDSIKGIDVLTVNSKSSKNGNGLDYQNNPDGLRVIIVGGMSLSRGLTLEGLMVSYFNRNSKMYDTLLQMGRWFGYRPKYDQLFRIWLSQDVRASYGEIAEAIEELKMEIHMMNAQNRTPMEYGLRVKTSPNALLVTAPNKMRSAKDETLNVSLSEVAVETPFVFIDEKTNQNNIQAVEILKQHIENTVSYDNDLDVFPDVEKEKVLDLLETIDTPYLNMKFNRLSIIEFLSTYQGLHKWDVAFVGGESKIHNVEIRGKTIPYVVRNYSVENLEDGRQVISVSAEHRRLGSPSDLKRGLSQNEIEVATKLYHEDYTKRKPDKKEIPSIGGKAYLKFVKERKPLLLIYYIHLKAKDTNKDKEFDGQTSIGFALAIPRLENARSENFAKYKINFRKYQELSGIVSSEGDDDED